MGQVFTRKNMVTRFFQKSNFSDFLGFKSDIRQYKDSEWVVGNMNWTVFRYRVENLAYLSTGELLVGHLPLIHSYVENSKIRYTNSRLVLHISILNNLQYQRILHWSKSHPTMNTWQDYQSIDGQVHEQKQMQHLHLDPPETLKLDSPDMRPPPLTDKWSVRSVWTVRWALTSGLL